MVACWSMPLGALAAEIILNFQKRTIDFLIYREILNYQTVGMKLRGYDDMPCDRMPGFVDLLFDWKTMYRIRQHPLIITLLNLEGNPRASVYTEPMWGIPFNLYIPYTSVYMLALGISDVQIGIIASLSLLI